MMPLKKLSLFVAIRPTPAFVSGVRSGTLAPGEAFVVLYENVQRFPGQADHDERTQILSSLGIRIIYLSSRRATQIS